MVPGSVWTPWVRLQRLQFSSVQFSYSVMSDSLQPHGLQHARPTCPLSTSGVCSNSCPLSQWWMQTNITINLWPNCKPGFMLMLFVLSCKTSGQFSSVTQSCPTLCDPMGCRMPGLLVHYQFLELTQTHVHWVDDAIQPSHPLSSPSPPTFSLPQHQGIFQWVSSSHQVAKVLEFQLQHQSFQWIFRTDFL